MTSREPSGQPYDNAHVMYLGEMTSVTVQPILTGRVVELSVCSDLDGDQDVWITPAEAYELAERLMDSADLAERMTDAEISR